MKKNDSKYFYTAELMNQALLELLKKKDIDFITVTEITKKAGVNRSTFYLHYENVYELLEETVENLNKKFLASFGENGGLQIKSKEDAFLLTEKWLVPYLKFVKENKRVLKLIHQKPQLFQAQTVYQKIYDRILRPAVSQFVLGETEQIYVLEFYTSGVLAIVRKWMALDCETEIDELLQIIKNCVKYDAE